jgi:thymidine kinase
MIKLIIGEKGAGKTKALIERVNGTIETTKGSVVVIAKGKKLMHEVKYQARLIDTDEVEINNPHSLYGLVAGVISSDYDAHDLFIDSALRIIEDVIAEFEVLVPMLDKLTATNGINLTMTVSIAAEKLPESLKKFVEAI